jgi:hypothetical protein
MIIVSVFKYKVIFIGQNKERSWVLVAHTCNPSYLIGRDQEDLGSKPAQAYCL